MRPVCDKIQISYAEYGQEAEERPPESSRQVSGICREAF